VVQLVRTRSGIPTGRNFYSLISVLFPQKLPGMSVVKLLLIELYPGKRRISKLWVYLSGNLYGLGVMMAEALALLGVQPVWDGVSRRVVDFEMLLA